MKIFYFCSCPCGLEKVLAEEILEIAKYADVKAALKIHNLVSGGIYCSGTMLAAYYLNLYSRIANRILLRIASNLYKDENDIYNLSLQQSWESWFQVTHSIRVNVTTIKSPIHSIKFLTLKIKDAICDRFRKNFNNLRPSINTKNPDMRIFCFLNSHQATLYLDTSGDPLFKRGWRIKTGEAPLKENLAAGLLRMIGWRPGQVLFDPMCGAGTILVEAAQIISGIPAGSKRNFAFEKFINFNQKTWNKLKSKINFNCTHTKIVSSLYGSDISKNMIQMTNNNLRNAGIFFKVSLKQINAKNVYPPQLICNKNKLPYGIMLTNLPYGKRIDIKDEKSLKKQACILSFINTFNATLKQRFPGWDIFMFSANRDLQKTLRLKAFLKTSLFNGGLTCNLFGFRIAQDRNSNKLLALRT